MRALDKADARGSFSGILVLPTGGGKTITTSYWLTKNAINRHAKVLWIAHRTQLLEQTYEAFCRCAAKELLPDVTEYNMSIVSGEYGKASRITGEVDVLIAMRNSLQNDPSVLGSWLWNYDGTVYFVIDECHHTAAATYQKVYSFLFQWAVARKSRTLKTIGLTATPYRTLQSETWLLKRVFQDNILYKIDLQQLIQKRILAKPILEEVFTGSRIGGDLPENVVQKINENDTSIPELFAEEIAGNAKRNEIIVQTYCDYSDKYGKTIVFALNQYQAVDLKCRFACRGVKAEVVISNGYNTQIALDDKDNAKKIAWFKNGLLDVLINVMILTEGTDLPKTHTIFLARPTTSKILMTQMIGRGLRGEAAGGTKDAYIVSFVDNWLDKINWVSPKQLEEFSEFPQTKVPVSAKYDGKEKSFITEDAIQDAVDKSMPFVGNVSYSIREIKEGDTNFEINTKEAVHNCLAEVMNIYPHFQYDEAENGLICDDEKLLVDVSEEDGSLRIFKKNKKGERDWVMQTVGNPYEYLTNYFNRYEETVEHIVPKKRSVSSSKCISQVGDDGKMMEVLEYCRTRDTISISRIQRKFGMGYARAGRMIDSLEEMGIVDGYNGSKPRRVNHEALEKKIANADK